MAINPLGSNGTPGAGSTQPRGAQRGEAVTPAGPGAGDSTGESNEADTVQLSDVAAAAALGTSVPAGELSAEALRAITDRVASGAYDSAEAIDRLAGKLISRGEV